MSGLVVAGDFRGDATHLLVPGERQIQFGQDRQVRSKAGEHHHHIGRRKGTSVFPDKNHLRAVDVDAVGAKPVTTLNSSSSTAA